MPTAGRRAETGSSDKTSAGEQLEPKVADLDTVLQLLPACRRCRRNKRRCDIRLPACLNCSRVGAECIFFDHVSKELLPRTYIASLVDHLKALEATIAIPVSSAPAPTSGSGSGSAPALPAVPVEHHFVQVRGAYRYLGHQAPLAASTGSAAPHGLEGQAQAQSQVQVQVRADGVCPPLQIPPGTLLDPGMHQFLVIKYFDTVHSLYPVADSTLADLTEPQRSLSDLTPSQSFMLHMVYSIACHCLPGNDRQLVLLSDAFYREALAHAEKITADLTLEALQAVLMLAIRSLFDAQNGSLGQQVAFAHRLEVELSAREVEETTPTPILQQLRKSIFCIGNQLATALDRPSGLVETEMTISSDKSDDSELLSHLYRVQSKFRSGMSFHDLDLDLGEIEEIIATDGSPLLLAALNETRFLLEPGVESALRLLNTYASDDMVLNIFTSHWAYKAALLLLQHGLNEAPLPGPGRVLAQKVLERCALKWPNSRGLLDSLNLYAPQ